MAGKSCFFIGHREADERLLPELEKCVVRLILEEGVSNFYVGGYGGFDRLAATAVKKVKAQHPGIMLMLVLPYLPAERPVILSPGFDGSYYPDRMEKVPRRFAIVRANQRMIDCCDWLICYVCRGASNSRNLLEYAKRRSNKGIMQIINLANEDDVAKLRND